MGLHKNIAIFLDLSIIPCLIYYVLANHFYPEIYNVYLSRGAFIWGNLRALYMLISDATDAAYGSTYDYDSGGYKSL